MVREEERRVWWLLLSGCNQFSTREMREIRCSSYIHTWEFTCECSCVSSIFHACDDIIKREVMRHFFAIAIELNQRNGCKGIILVKIFFKCATVQTSACNCAGNYAERSLQHNNMVRNTKWCYGERSRQNHLSSSWWPVTHNASPREPRSAL